MGREGSVTSLTRFSPHTSLLLKFFLLNGFMIKASHQRIVCHNVSHTPLDWIWSPRGLRDYKLDRRQKGNKEERIEKRWKRMEWDVFIFVSAALSILKVGTLNVAHRIPKLNATTKHTSRVNKYSDCFCQWWPDILHYCTYHCMDGSLCADQELCPKLHTIPNRAWIL